MTIEKLREIIHDWHMHKYGMKDYPTILIGPRGEIAHLMIELSRKGFVRNGQISMPEATLDVAIWESPVDEVRLL